MASLSRRMMCFTVVAVALLSSITASDSCPTGCSCEPVGNLICTHIDTFPVYFAGSDIASLTIKNHSITELKTEDLQKYTKLKRLDLANGNLESIENDAFAVIKDTIITINLDSNKLVEIPKGLFKDMTKLRQLNMTKNKLQILKEDTFVNMGELITLFLELNNISTIEEGALKDIPKLDNINMFRNKLKGIPVVGLKAATNCRKLDLSFNQITEIPEDLGGELESLEDLDLESNPIVSMKVFPKISKTLKILNVQFIDIPSIVHNAWTNLPNLEQLFLSGSLFEELNKDMFSGLQNVNTIFLMSLPRLRKVGPNTFSNLTNLKSLHLSWNRELADIDDSAFSPTNMSYVYLQENKLSTFHENLLNWTSLKFVSLHDNPVNCDCQLAWMFKPKYKSVKSNFSQVVCTLPLKYSGKSLMTLQQSDLTCGTTHRERLGTGIAVAVFCLIFMALSIILYRCRKNITMRCRRYFMYKRYQNDLVFTVENDTAIGELDDGDTRPLKDLRLETD